MYPNCPNLTLSGRYCSIHKKNNKSYYSSKEWREIRAEVLQEEPICRICGKQPSNEVDHIIPIDKGGTSNRWNLRGTCKKCHSAKTRIEVSR